MLSLKGQGEILRSQEKVYVKVMPQDQGLLVFLRGSLVRVRVAGGWSQRGAGAREVGTMYQ